ncbi:MAG: TPM domain-containing protein [Melioribacter sp.]|nr:TPM domain-containing protein [Melioribacter sp.]
MKKSIIYNFFTDDDFLRFSKKIKEAEKLTSGEIRVCIKEFRNIFEKRKDIRQLAEKEFYKLNMQNTKDKTGVLLYLLLSERKFYILADEGINSKVEENTWYKLRDEIQTKFKEGKFSDGIIYCIEKVGEILKNNFPIKPNDTNELSNKIVIS